MQSLAVNVLGGDKVLVIGFADFIDRDDVRKVEGRSRLRFLPEDAFGRLRWPTLQAESLTLKSKVACPTCFQLVIKITYTHAKQETYNQNVRYLSANLQEMLAWVLGIITTS
jgi:hypothetical protein